MNIFLKTNKSFLIYTHMHINHVFYHINQVDQSFYHTRNSNLILSSKFLNLDMHDQIVHTMHTKCAQGNIHQTMYIFMPCVLNITSNFPNNKDSQNILKYFKAVICLMCQTCLQRLIPVVLNSKSHNNSSLKMYMIMYILYILCT